MRKAICSLAIAVLMAVCPVSQVLAATTKTLYVDFRDSYAFKLELPYYIGDSDALDGYELVDVDGYGIEDYYVSPDLSEMMLSIFMVDSEDKVLPIKHLAFKDCNQEYLADGVEILVKTASLEFNGNTVEFTHDMLYEDETESIDRGDYFENTINYYTYHTNTAFLMNVYAVFYSGDLQFYTTVSRVSGIVLTPSMVDEAKEAGTVNGQFIPGLKERLSNYIDAASSSSDDSGNYVDMADDSGADFSGVKLVYNGSVLNINPPAIEKNGYAMFPFEEVMLALGISHDWNGETSTVTAILGDNTVDVRMTDNRYLINGVELDIPEELEPFSADDRTYIYPDYVLTGLGISTEWDDISKSIIINNFK